MGVLIGRFNMPGVVRKPDICSMGVSSCEYSPDTYVNNLNVERYGDKLCDGASHCGVHDVFTNSRMNQTCGDCNTHPCVMVTCSGDTFIN